MKGVFIMEIRNMKCDVCVIGGGPGGLCAAIAATRRGADVILCERNGHLGGNAAMGLPLLGYLSQSGRQIIGGIAQEFITELEKSGDSFGHQRCPMHNSITLVHPDKFKLLALKMCLDAGVRLLLHSELCDTVINNGKLTRVSVIGKGTRVDIDADVFIDGTGDGDLGFMAGARYEKSDELQPPTTMFALTGFHKEKFMRFLEEHPENMAQLDSVHIDPGYDTTLWRSTDSYVFVGMKAYLDEIRKKYPDCPIKRENIIYINSTIPGKIWVNTVRVPGCDGSDIESLTDGEVQGLLQIPGIVKTLKDYVPGFEDCVLDEICPAIGIRESRRICGITRIDHHDALAGKKPDDTIALSGYKIDIHSGKGAGTILMKIPEPYGIPLSACICKDIDGLLMSGRCISMDRETLGSMRVMPTCMAIGEAVGVLAAEATQRKASPRSIPAGDVRKILAAAGAILQ